MSARSAGAGSADGSILERLETELDWPRWDHDRSAMARAPDPSQPDAREAVAEALARARPVAEGGAYTWIDRDPVGGAGTGAHPGWLAHFTFAVKDLIAVDGRPLGAGSAVRSTAPVEPADAPVVGALRRAGATLIGTTALHEFAFGVTGVNAHTGTPANPHDRERIPGGSSSGSAVAVAEGSARVALGTDTGGSIRIPAALCGVVGYKPAFGSYPGSGVFPLSPTLDHVALCARAIPDVLAVQRALGRPVLDGRVERLRIGFAPDALEGCDGPVAERLAFALLALEEAGCKVTKKIAWPSSAEAFAPSTAILFAEAAAVHRADLERHPELYGPDVRGRLETGLAISAPLYVTAQRRAEELRVSVRRTLAEVDVVAEPTLPLTAPTLREAEDPALPARLVSHTRLGNLVGAPTVSLPVPGPGLPVGLQLTAADEAHLLASSAYVEAVLGAAYNSSSGSRV